MKKLNFIFVLLAFCVLITGCFQEKGQEAEGAKTDEEILSEYLDSIMFPDYISEDLELNLHDVFQNKEITIIWKSSDENVLSSDGKITFYEEEHLVTLTAQAYINETMKSKNYQITIDSFSRNEIASYILDSLVIDNEVYNSIELPKSITYLGEEYSVFWATSNKQIIESTGLVHFDTTDKEATLTARLNYKGSYKSKDFNIIVKAFDVTKIDKMLDTITLPDAISNDITLVSSVMDEDINYSVIWESSNDSLLTNDGKIGITTNDTVVNLKASVILDNITRSKTFSITIKKSSVTDVLEITLNNIYIPTEITENLDLNFDFPADVVASWNSSNPQVLTNSGEILGYFKSFKEVTLTLALESGGERMTKEYKSKVFCNQHMYVETVFNGEFNNASLNQDGQIVLNDNALDGHYITKEIETDEFSEAVASWGAISSTTATCELFVRLRVNGSWSDYISYGEWGQGLNNAATNQSNSLIKLDTDEIIVSNSNYATAFQMKIVLKRKSLSDDLPRVNMLALTLKIKNYTYNVDSSYLKGYVKYDVPKLYQHDVPTIGGIICSATSSTMLLKYKGHDFSNLGTYEHQYIASIVKDYGNNIYGNWVYNCVGMSSFGEISYVKRFYSDNELFYSLENVGPISASIKGTVIYTAENSQTQSSYTTNGHLIVVTGYEKTEDGTYVYINDPNVAGVSIRMTLSNFLAVWRNIAYIIL